MRRAGLLIGGWVAATALALGFGLLGVRAVSNSVTNPRPAALSPSSVKAALARAEGDRAPGAQAASTTTVTPATGSASDDGAPAASSGSGPDPRSVGGAAAPPTDGGSQPASVGSPFSSSQPPPPSESSGSDDDHEAGGAAQDRTYNLVGGSVGIRFEDGGAHLLWAQPNTGFSMTKDTGDNEVEIVFTETNGDHVSHLHAYWSGGPQADIEEGSD